MTYSACAVANAFVQRAKDGRLKDLTPMKLQRLLFFAQSWHLSLASPPLTPLFDDFFARWPLGPVVSSVHHKFKDYGSSSIKGWQQRSVKTRGRRVRLLCPPCRKPMVMPGA